MGDLLPFLLAIITGLLTTLEAAFNAKLGRLVTPKMATLYCLMIGAIAMIIINLFSGNFKNYYKISDVSSFWLLGGIFGAFAIYLLSVIIPKLGVTITFTVVITFQMLSSFYIDAFILHQQFKFIQFIGATLIITGMYLIML